MCGTTGIREKNVRHNWNPREKCAVQLESYRKMCGTNVRQNWIRSSRQRRPSYPENPQSNADRPDRRRPGKSPNRRRPAGPPRRRPGKSPIRRRPAGPPPAGKIPKPNRLVLLLSVCLLLSSPHGKAGSAGKKKISRCLLRFTISACRSRKCCQMPNI